jgi:23S rRNA (cytidine1920-2'-O)/16S rRNA (cytidine1409-2'-O)-methyltransferase
MHERLRADTRVVVRERTDLRSFAAGAGGERFDVVVADLSFISMRTVAPALMSLARPGADLVVLVKPQFEAGRREASRGRGVIKDPEVWRRTLVDAITALESAGSTMIGIMASPLRGADGNVEFLVHLRRHPAALDSASRSSYPPPGPDPGPSGAVGIAVERVVADAVAEGEV